MNSFIRVICSPTRNLYNSLWCLLTLFWFWPSSYRQTCRQRRLFYLFLNLHSRYTYSDGKIKLYFCLFLFCFVFFTCGWTGNTTSRTRDAAFNWFGAILSTERCHWGTVQKVVKHDRLECNCKVTFVIVFKFAALLMALRENRFQLSAGGLFTVGKTLIPSVINKI